MPRGTAPGGTADVAANPDADWDRDGIVSTRDLAQFGSRSYVAALPQGQFAQPANVDAPLSPANGGTGSAHGFGLCRPSRRRTLLKSRGNGR